MGEIIVTYPDKFNDVLSMENKVDIENAIKQDFMTNLSKSYGISMQIAVSLEDGVKAKIRQDEKVLLKLTDLDVTWQ